MIYILYILYFIFYLTHSVSEEIKETENLDSKPDDDEQSPTIYNTIENEEWLAYIRKTMQEVMNGEINSLKDPNLVRLFSIVKS